VDSVDVARFLLKQYPDTVNRTTSEEDDRWTPLHMAAQSGSVDCIELLLQHGANIEATTSDGSTPLHIAAANGPPKIITAILSQSCSNVTRMRISRRATAAPHCI
jgi:ankyrin repeat protein